MPRIFKFSKFALKLFVPHASELTDMKIYIYTDNFDIAYVVTSGFKINVNEVGIVIPQNAVNNMSDGIINYRIEGYLNGEFYMEQRQSNYFLKTPSFEIEDTNIIAISTDFVDEGNYKMIIKASEYNVDGLSQVEIDATTFAEEKYEEGNVAGIEIGKEVQKAKLTGITITENGIYSREDGYNEIHVEVPDLNGDYQTGYDAGYVDGEYRGFNNGYTAGETDQKDKLESISITENGTYTREDGYNEVIVNVEQEGGSCNLQEIKFEQRDNTEEFFNILPDEGYDCMSQVDVDIRIPLETKYNEGLEQGKTEGKEDVVNSLQTLNVTENGTYTPSPTPFLRLDSDDKYEMFFPSENNAFEIKFRVNGEGFTEFLNQEGNNEYFISLKAFIDTSVLYIRWFNKQIYISDVDFSKWHTLVVKMGDENAMVIFDKQVYNDYHKFGSYKDNGNAVNIFGNINLSLDLEHFTLWNTWEEYNNGDTPYFDFKVSSEGLMKNQQGGEYSVVNNIGGGSAQCMEEQMTEGWNKVIVDVKNDFNKVEMSLNEYLSLAEYDNNTIYLLN